MKVVLLAGGKGLRLRPYTTVLPKPLLPLGDKPILEHLLNHLRRHNFEKVYLCVGYLSSLIRAYFGDGKNWGIEIEYVEEEKPLGTAGSLSLLPEMKEPFLVLNGDLVTDLDFEDIVKYHIANKSLLTIGVHKLNYKLPLGFLEVDDKNKIVDYIEKPVRTYNMSMGIYVCDPAVLKYVKKNEYLDFPDLTRLVIKDKGAVSPYFNEALWLDVGRPEEYEKAAELFEKKKDPIA